MSDFISPDLCVDPETRHKLANDIQVEKLEAAIRRREKASGDAPLKVGTALPLLPIADANANEAREPSR